MNDKRIPPQKRAQGTGLAKVASIIAVSSCKGGVGKSTLAAALARELAGRKLKVGLVDADIFGPSIPSLFGLTQTTVYSNADRQLIPVKKDNVKIMSFGFLLGDGPAVIRGPIVTQYTQQMLHHTDWGELDYLLIDMPPGTGDIQLTITQTAQLDGAVIVTTPQTLSLIDVARGILMFEKVNVPILGLIENMSYFVCDSCDKKHYPFGKNTGQTLKDRFGIGLLGEIPLLDDLIQNSGPLIRETADRILKALEQTAGPAKNTPAIAFDDKHVTLTWDGEPPLVIGNKELRLSCRCALCINEVTGEKILKEGDVKDNIAPTAITPLGNYAISIVWNDRHSSGIYPYASIRNLVKAAK